MQTSVNDTQEKSLWLYIPLYVLFVYIFMSNLDFHVETNTNPIIGVMYFIEFGIHEISHIVTMFLPPVFVAAAGSGGEIAFTLLLVGAALKYKAYFTVIFGSLWFMLACKSVGTYMADARTQLLPLIGPAGEGAQHDWHFVFSQLGWLPYDTTIGGFVIFIGVIAGIIAMLGGLWLLFVMAFGNK